MNAPQIIPTAVLAAPQARPAAKVGFTAGSLVELFALGCALLVPAVAAADDFGPDPGHTARIESRGDVRTPGLYENRDARPAYDRPSYTEPAVGRSVPRAEPKPVPTAAERVGYRYRDPNVVRFATNTGWNRLVGLYQESSRLIDARHHRPNGYQARVEQALTNLSAAVEDADFRAAHRINPSARQIDGFRDGLARISSKSVRNGNDAVAAMQDAARLARRDLNLAADAVAAEFLYGAVESLDRFSGFTPDETRTGYGADATIIPAAHAASLDIDARTAGPLDTSVVGLGVELKEHDKGVVVMKPLAGGPAAEGGVKRGDVIVAVDGVSLAGKGLNGAADLIVGREGSSVRLTVLRDGRTGTFNLRRARVELKTVSVVEMMTAPNGRKVGYLKMDRWAATSDSEMDEALWNLYRGGMQALVIDLRGNPGGLLDQAISISDKFLPGGTIVATKGRLAEDNTSAAARKARTWKIPLAVIVDDGSASASEIFAAAVQDNRRGVLVGRQSYGKGTVQTHFPVSAVPGTLKLTTAMFYSPSGREMADQGVAPDVRVEADEDILPLVRDADVRAALAAAAGRTAAQMAATPGAAR